MHRPTPHHRGARLLFEELERRLLLSADVAPGLILPAALIENAPAPVVDLDSQGDSGDADAAAALESRRELVFVDPGIADREALLDDLQGTGRWLEVVVLDAERDGVAQIAEVLGRYEELDAVHVFSHGSAGALQLGSSWLDAATLAQHRAALASWGDALASGADLLFYGCELGQGADGAAFSASLAELTGADVAASTDPTGSAALGGDWELEHASGRVETAAALETGGSWSGLLGVEPALWISTAGDVSGSGADGLDAWSGGAAVQIGPTDLSFGTGSSAGAFSLEFDLDDFASVPGTGINALHYVSRDLTLGGPGGFELREGDLVLSTSVDDRITLTSSNSLNVKSRDIFVFRPDSSGDYSSGSFLMLLEEPMPRDTTSFTLVEHDTVLGDVTLLEGDLLFSAKAANNQNQIVLFRASEMQGGALQGSMQVLLDGGDAGLGAFDGAIDGLELVERETSIGDATLPAGTLLLSFQTDVSVGSNGLGVAPQDIVRLDVSQTTLGSGVGNGQATASLLFEGSGAALDSEAEALDALAIVPVQVTNLKLSLPGQPLDYVENDPATRIDPGAVLEPGSGDFDGGSLVVEFLANGTAADRLEIQGGGALSVAGNQILYEFGSGPVAIGTFSGGDDAATPLVVQLGAAADAGSVQALLRAVSFRNVSEDPSPDTRVLRFRVTEAGGQSAEATTPVQMTAINDAPLLELPGAQSVEAGTPLVFSTANGNVALVSDVDATSVEVTLSVANGTLTLGDTTGLVFSEGTGAGDARMTFQGNIAVVNAALDGLRFDPTSDFDGSTALAIQTSDLGQSGAGGALGASSVVAIEVTPAPEPEPPPPPPPEPPPSPPPEPPPPEPPMDPPPDPDEEDDGESTGEEDGREGSGEPAPPPPDPVEDTFAPPGDLPELTLEQPDPLPRDSEVSRDDAPAAAVPTSEETTEAVQTAGPTEEDRDEDTPRVRERPRFSVGLSSPVASEALDQVRRDLTEEAERAEHTPGLGWTMARGVAVAFSTSILGALLRGGSLLAMTLSSLPIWLRFDPLAILALSESERKRRERELREARRDEDERGVGRLFEEDAGAPQEE